MNYESTFIISSKLSAEKSEELLAKVSEIIGTSKGSVKTIQQLGKKKLAYPINKIQEGNYVYIEFSGEGAVVKALENFFKFNESVMRFLTVKAEDKKVAAAKPVSKQVDKAVESAESATGVAPAAEQPNAAEVKQDEPAGSAAESE